MNLNDTVSETMTPTGPKKITSGAVLCAQVRGGLRSVLKHHDPEGYEAYHLLKYPTGPGSDTPESRMAAVRFLFDRTRDVLCPHYLSSKETSAVTGAVDEDQNDEGDDDQDEDEGDEDEVEETTPDAVEPSTVEPAANPNV